MKREHWEKLLPVITEFVNGGELQRLVDEEWLNMDSPTFDAEPERYRIAPKARKVWVNEYPAEYGGDAKLITHTSKESADMTATSRRVACYEIKLPPLS